MRGADFLERLDAALRNEIEAAALLDILQRLNCLLRPELSRFGARRSRFSVA